MAMENPITFDGDACTRCGICAEVCPNGIIMQERQGALPLLVPAREATCIRCGHCVAVCPTGAISAGYPAEGPQYLTDGSAAIAPADLAAYLRSRRSIRRYEDRTVDRETIEALLDVVRFAPSGVNRQPVHWLIAHDPAEVHRLAGLTVEWMRKMVESGAGHPLTPIFPAVVRAWDAGEDPIFRGAPHLVVAHAEASNQSAFMDSIIALTWLEVAAPSFGLGTCWAGFFQIAVMSSPELAAALDLPEGHALQSAMFFGYPKYRSVRVPGREKARITWR